MRLRFSKCSMVFWFSLSTAQCLVLNSIRVRNIECILYNVVRWTSEQDAQDEQFIVFRPLFFGSHSVQYTPYSFITDECVPTFPLMQYIDADYYYVLWLCDSCESG